MSRAGFLARADASGIPLLTSRAIAGLWFLAFGVKKIAAEPQNFLKSLREYELLPFDPPVFINSMAVVLPWLEVVVGVCLVLGIFLRGASLSYMAMLLAFTTAVFLRALGVYGAEEIGFCSIQFDCGCGQGEVLICRKLAENSLLLALGLPILLSRSRRFCLGRGRRMVADARS